MSRRHELDAKLALYHDLGDILGAMRSFALTELRRIAKREEAQNQTASILFDALDDMAPALPEPGHVTGDVFVLIGSVRGFCSSFNEDVLGFWQRSKKADDSTIVVGERLISLIHGEESVVFVPGATNSNGVMPVIESILSAYGQICEKSDLNLGLVIVLRGADGVITKRLWPMQSEVSSKLKEIPHTNEAPSLVAASVAQNCLFHMLVSFLLRALHTENHMRLMQMESAIKHIDENKAALLTKRNRIRQEEIVNEIELILMERKSA